MHRLWIPLFILLVVVSLGANTWYTYATKRTITVEVTDKDRVVTSNSSSWLVFTKDDDVLQNVDSILYLKFNSSSVQGQLQVGHSYTVEIYGWRFGPFSMYPNIIRIVE